MPTKDKDQLPDVLRDLREQGDGYLPPGEDYFAALAERSLAAATAPAVVRPVHSYRWLSVAVAVLLLLTAGWFALGLTDSGGDSPVAGSNLPSSDELLAEIDPAEIDDYVSEQIDEFTLELYAEAPLNE